jgi:hypothetical protein
MRFGFSGAIPDLSTALSWHPNLTDLQEAIRRVVAGYRLAEAVHASVGTAKEALAAVDAFIEKLKAAHDAVSAPPPALWAVPDEARAATAGSLAILIAHAQEARVLLQPYQPGRGGQSAPQHLDLAVYHVVSLLESAGAKNPAQLAGKILGECEIPAPKSRQGIVEAHRRQQKRMGIRRVVRL